ncbi:MAG: choice-of-anchor L domain-containing protein, partial [Flavobacterium sp.]
MKIISPLLLSLLFCCFQQTKAQYIKVDDTFSTQYLVEKVLVNSTCAQVSNFNAAGDSFTTGRQSFGFFDGASTTFPFKEGVFLSTWSSSRNPGPYSDNQNNSGSSNWKGDADLDAALGITSINATVVEFDFVSLTDFISFNYLFASNEYQSYFPCQFSDGFAFLIKEKGSNLPYQNLAVLPGTSTPVASTTVHPFINPVSLDNSTNPGCPAKNETYFNGYNTFTSPINYAGQTKVLTAETKVTAGKTYHIKLVIADDGWEDFDSAVFIEAGSFSSKIALGPDRLINSNNPICSGEQLVLNTSIPATNSHKWFKNGVEIPGENQPKYTVTSAGEYTVEVTFVTSCVLSEGIKIEYANALNLNDASIIQCDVDGDGLTEYDLATFDAQIKNNDSNSIKTTWHSSLTDAQNDTNPIALSATFSNTSLDQKLYVKAASAFGCSKIATITLSTSTIRVASPNSIAICDGDSVQDGLYEFDLSTLVTPELLKNLPAGLTADYYLSAAAALIEKNKLPAVFKNTQAFSQIIYARIKNGNDCYGITPITLEVITFDPKNFETETVFICSRTPLRLNVDTNFSGYLWNTAQTTASIAIQQEGTFSVTVTNNKGCQKTKTFLVKSSEKAVYEGAEIKDFAGNNNTITLLYSGKGAYEFSLNNVTYQDSP